MSDLRNSTQKLSYLQAIVEAHRGTVAVDDAPGGGARFTVRLPR